MIYLVASDKGGLADYADYQIRAILRQGEPVLAISTKLYASTRSGYPVVPLLEDDQRVPTSLPRTMRRILRLPMLVGNMQRVAKYIDQSGERVVMMGSYSEYAAPLWAGSFRTLRKKGLKFGAVLHDPIRNHQVGPVSWHRWSIQEGYSFLDVGFYHDWIDRTEAQIPEDLRLVPIPHGMYDFPPSVSGRAETRARLGIPLEAKLLLSFGQIRDAKNLHLVLEAMRGQDRAWLVVAGKEASANQRSIHDYQRLALELGVAERVVWNQGYVAEQEAANLFEAADAVVLAYSRLFRSASGVLSLAIRYRRPCLVSAGDSPLRNEAIAYKLGVCVEPDSAQALRDGMHQLFSRDSDCRWDEYMDDHTWEKNAKLVLSAMKPHAS